MPHSLTGALNGLFPYSLLSSLAWRVMHIFLLKPLVLSHGILNQACCTEWLPFYIRAFGEVTRKPFGNTAQLWLFLDSELLHAHLSSVSFMGLGNNEATIKYSRLKVMQSPGLSAAKSVAFKLCCLHLLAGSPHPVSQV